MRSQGKWKHRRLLPTQVPHVGRSCQPSWGAQMGSDQIKQEIPLVQWQIKGCEYWAIMEYCKMNHCIAGPHINLLLTENNAVLFVWKGIDISCLRGGSSQQFQFCFSCQLHSNQIQNPKADSFFSINQDDPSRQASFSSFDESILKRKSPCPTSYICEREHGFACADPQVSSWNRPYVTGIHTEAQVNYS